jgi:hypothetical protein
MNRIKKLIIFIFILLIFGLGNNSWGGGGFNFEEKERQVKKELFSTESIKKEQTQTKTEEQKKGQYLQGIGGTGTGGTGTEQAQTKPAKIKVEFKTIPGQICPPGILGTGPCSYPTLEDIANKIINLILNISPYLLTFLLVLGGFVYLLSPFKVEEYIKKGHNYIKYAILGYILILLLSLIFSIISAIIGGP